MTSDLLQTTVGQIVARRPALAQVFEKHQIDYCCRGGTTLAEACRLQNADVDEIVREIESVRIDKRPADETDWNEASLTDLAGHIVDTHHAYLTAELPRLTSLIAKVQLAHGEKQPSLSNVQRTFKLMREELESHMAKEENVLFPAIKVLEAQGGPQSFLFGSINNPIRMMEQEHDGAGNALRRLRELTDNFTPPSDACPTYRVMLETLENLERDLHLHIHKENNILFPRAAKLEEAASTI